MATPRYDTIGLTSLRNLREIEEADCLWNTTMSNASASPLSPGNANDSETSSTGFKSFWKSSKPSGSDKTSGDGTQSNVTFVQQDPSGVKKGRRKRANPERGLELFGMMADLNHFVEQVEID